MSNRETLAGEVEHRHICPQCSRAHHCALSTCETTQDPFDFPTGRAVLCPECLAFGRELESGANASAAAIKGRRVVVSLSGGKDSAALSLWLHEQGVEHDRIFADTGWEHADTYRYLREVLEPRLGPVTWLHPRLQMADLIRSKAMFPSRLRRYCTQQLKIKPILDYFAARMEEGVECVNAIGVRAGESRARAKLGEWEWCEGFEVETWRPLLRWSEADVLDCLRRNGIPLNPLYLRGAERVGCWPCIFARKSEIRRLAELDPGRIDEIRALEAEVQAGQLERAEKKGLPLKISASFFQAPNSAEGICWPIDKVVAWSQTARGGRQFELFAAGFDGCARWGVCESAETGDGDREG